MKTVKVILLAIVLLFINIVIESHILTIDSVFNELKHYLYYISGLIWIGYIIFQVSSYHIFKRSSK